jgi:hypothetical protein
MKLSAGGLDFPWCMSPQQAALLSDFTPQVCHEPALTWMKLPSGGLD